MTDIINDDTLQIEYATTNKKDVNQKYRKMSNREHIIKRPDTYIGSIEPNEDVVPIYDSEKNSFVDKKITYIEGLYKIFDEILVNAYDQCIRLNEDLYRQQTLIKKRKKTDEEKELIKRDIKYTKNIHIWISRSKNYIRIRNDGEGISSAIHSEYKVHIPQLIFGEVLTSSNYDDDEFRIGGGRNGYGGKLCNIFSTKFIVETIDIDAGVKYQQTFAKNMSLKNKPHITKINKKTQYPYTQITFYPDLSKFKFTSTSVRRNENEIDEGTYQLFIRRAYDIAACVPSYTNVYLNGKKIEINSFEDYVKMYIGNDTKYFTCSPHRWWDIVVTTSPDHVFKQMSFVNGIATLKAGKHVSYVTDHLSSELSKTKQAIKEKIIQRYIKDNMWVFVKCSIVNPSFTTQTKETLTTQIKAFGSSINFGKMDITKLIELDILDRASKLSEFKKENEMKKTDGKKTSNIFGIPKLMDADYAGTSKSDKCYLIVTEGDSASTFANDLRSHMDKNERKYFGIFPLRGKMLNVKKAKITTLQKNKEINALKKIIGLRQGIDYLNDVKSLRYGGVVVMTDADLDGDHIKGLFINFLHRYWRSLLKRNGFVKTIALPIVKARRNEDAEKSLSFYDMNSFNKWLDETPNAKNWYIKYYKGLGTYEPKEAEELIAGKHMMDLLINYNWDDENVYVRNVVEKIEKQNEKSQNMLPSNHDDENSDDFIEMFDVSTSTHGTSETSLPKDMCYRNVCDYCIDRAFKSDYIAERKAWLYDVKASYNFDDVNSALTEDITYEKYFNQRFINFSLYDNTRSIPNIMDGLKPSQRKILCGFMRRPDKQLKVVQLAGYISEHMEYMHGEASLQSTIITMAQDFVGTNNVNLFKPIGQFGTRKSNGKDSASPRYIFTKLMPITHVLFSNDDYPLLKKTCFDGNELEPIYYQPILPTILMNGSIGIGTGYSTKIPQYHPFDICNILVKLMNGKDFEEPVPWYRGFKGKITKVGDGIYSADGSYDIDNTKVTVTEIPIGKSFDTYDEFLGKKAKNEIDGKKKKNERGIIDYKADRHNVNPTFTITFSKDKLSRITKNGENGLMNFLGLKRNIKTSNLTLFDTENKMKKYTDVKSIILEFYTTRLQLYELRHKFMLKKAKLELMKLKNKYRFMKDVIDKTITLHNRPENDVINELDTNKYMRFSSDWLQSLDKVDFSTGSFNYLLKMSFSTMIKENLEKLREQIRKANDYFEWLKQQDAKKLWMTDIRTFREEFKVMMKDWYKIHFMSGTTNDPYYKLYFNDSEKDEFERQNDKKTIKVQRKNTKQKTKRIGLKRRTPR